MLRLARWVVVVAVGCGPEVGDGGSGTEDGSGSQSASMTSGGSEGVGRSCEDVCTFIVPAGCAAGPPDQTNCVMGCEQVRAGPCAIAYSDTLACTGETPTFTCDAEARPLVAGCEADFIALYACLGI